MKKQAKTKVNRKKNSQRAPTAPAKKTRREMLISARNWAIGGLAVGGAGYLVVDDVMASVREHNLERVNNGVPTVVQIHDPQCSMCQSLQRATRKALSDFDDAEVDYVIANIRTGKGQNFANQYRVQHVTLLLFNSDGRLKEVLTGVRPETEIKREITRLLAANR